MEIHVFDSPDNFIDIQKELSDNKQTVSTTITENKELAMKTLLSFVETLKGKFAKYIDPIVRVALPMVTFNLNESVRGLAASLLAGLVEVKFLSGQANAIQDTIHMSQVFLQLLWQTLDEEYVNEAEISQLKAIKQILEIPNISYLTQTDVGSMGEKLVKVLSKSIEKRKIDANSDEEQDEEYLEYVKEEIENLQVAISEVFGVLFKTQKEMTLPIVNFLIRDTFPKLLGPSSLDQDHKLVIFIVDDIIEYLGYDLVKDSWPAFAEVLIRFSLDSQDEVRQASCYGLGVLASNTAPEIFKPWTPYVIASLEKALQYPVSKKIKSYGYAKDNAIAAIGKIIKFQAENLDLTVIIPVFVEMLPIKYDKLEAKYMNDILADLML